MITKDGRRYSFSRRDEFNIMHWGANPFQRSVFAPRIGYWFLLKFFVKLCVDIFVISPDGELVLLGLRLQNPAQNFWWPSGGGLRRFIPEIVQCQEHVRRDFGENFPLQDGQFVFLGVDRMFFPDSDCYITWWVDSLLYYLRKFKWNRLEAFAKKYMPASWLKLMPCDTPVHVYGIRLNELQFALAQNLILGGQEGRELKGKKFFTVQQVVQDSESYDEYVCRWAPEASKKTAYLAE